MQFEPLSDEYLARIAASDEEAAAHFVRYFGALILIKLRARYLPPPVIDEVRQETIVRVLIAIRKKNSIQDARKLGSFVFSTCNHVLSEHFRSDMHYTPLEDTHLERMIQELDSEKSLLARETQAKVHRVLARLPERDRKVLTALFLEERDKDLICEEFGIDRGYLRVLLHRAKLNFRGEWSSSQ